MKVGLVYPRIYKSTLRDGDVYDLGANRFYDTLKDYYPSIPFSLWWYNVNGSGPAPSVAFSYDGDGFDVGVWMDAARNTDCDFMIFSNSLTYFHRPGWMEAIVDARKRFGDGLYGYFASFENNYHIRTTIWACNPATLNLYPERIVTRQDTLDFESGPKRFTRFIEKRNEPVILVTPDGFYDRSEWRSVNNGFRCGDQSNTWVRDRHTLIYDQATEEEKLQLCNTSWQIKEA